MFYYVVDDSLSIAYKHYRYDLHMLDCSHHHHHRRLHLFHLIAELYDDVFV